MTMVNGSQSRSDIRKFYDELITEQGMADEIDFYFEVSAEYWKSALEEIDTDYRKDKKSWAYPFINEGKLKTTISKNRENRYLLRVEMRPYCLTVRFFRFLHNYLYSPIDSKTPT